MTYTLVYDPAHRFEIAVTLQLPPQLAGKRIVMQRPWQNPKDHLRGWIEWKNPLPLKSIHDRTAWRMDVPQSGTLEYSYSFLRSEQVSESEFRNSRHDMTGLFIQTVDLFCFPEGISHNAHVKISLKGFSDPIVDWSGEGHEYSVLPQHINDTFLVDGVYRSHVMMAGSLPIRLFISGLLDESMDTPISKSIQASLSELKRSFPTIADRSILIIVLEITGNTSRAMRRGNTVVLGLPRNLPPGAEERKKIAHEFVHLLGDSEHDVAWFEEGVSEYLAWITLCRSHQITVEEFIGAISEKFMQLHTAHSHINPLLNTKLVYIYGMLSVFALDVSLRASDGSYRLEDLLNRAFSEGKHGPLSKRELTGYLTYFNVPKARNLIDSITDGSLDIEGILKRAGLKITESGFTLISDKINENGFDRILPTDTIISVNNQNLDREKWHQYLRDHVNQSVSVEIERDGVRMIQSHRIISKVAVQVEDSFNQSIWSGIVAN